MNRILSIFGLFFALITGLHAEAITIGTGTSTIGLPMNCFFGYSYTQTIYYQSEITAGMTISKIAYQYTGASWTDPDIKIYMGHTPKATFTSETDWVPLTEMTEVFSGAVTTVPGWVEINLSTPFVYSGTGNIVIAFDENTAGYHDSNDDFFSTGTPSVNRSLVFFNDNTNLDPAAPQVGSLIAEYANIKLIPQNVGPDFSISPSLCNYGLQVTNTTKVQNFVVKNIGTGYLDIASGNISITGADAASFSLGSINYPIHLAAYETAEIPVIFSSATTGDKSATLQIVDNITKSVHSIALSGSAYQAEQIPYTENFEADIFLPLKWKRYDGILTGTSNLIPINSGWIISDFGNAVENGKGAKVNVWGGGTKSWLISPTFNLGAANNDFSLKFDVALTKYNSSSVPDLNGTDDKFAIVISTDNGATWSSANILRQYDNAEGSTYVYNNFTPVKTTVDISLPNLSGMARIGFYVESTSGNADNDLHIDNVLLESSSAVNETCLPDVTTIAQNYPNPFNPETVISFLLAKSGLVELSVYSCKGELVRQLCSSSLNAGKHSFKFNALGLNSGVYFYKLSANETSYINKMILCK